MNNVILIVSSKLYSSWGRIFDDFLVNFNLMKARTFQTPTTPEIISQILALRSSRDIQSLTEGVNLILYGSSEDGFNRIAQLAKDFDNGSGDVFFSTNGQQTVDLFDLFFSRTSNNNSNITIKHQLQSSTATLDSCSCVVIKPHAVKAKLAGSILDDIISAGYEVSALTTVYFDKVQAEEFLEVYKGVVPEYVDHVIQFSSGLSIALEVRAENAVETFRWTAGPWDTGMAHELYPSSLRGKYGLDNVRNAVHCTDLPSHAQLECEYVHNIMEP